MVSSNKRRISTNVGALVMVLIAVAAGCAKEAAPLPLDAPPVETAAPSTDASPDVTAVPEESAAPGDQIGASWENATGNLAGLESECGNLSYVSARPDRRGLIASVALQGLWESGDGGDSWASLGQGEGSAVLTLRATDVQYDPEDPTRFWVSGLYNGGGAYETRDDGATFQQLGNIYSTEDISIDFTDPARQTIVSPLHERTDVFRSRDGGQTWEAITAGLPTEGGFSVATLVLDADTYLVGTRDGRVPGVFRTTDGGVSWTRASPTAVTGAPVLGSDGRMYWLMARGAGLLVSADEGVGWTEIPSDGISPFATTLVELPDGRFVAVSDTTLIESDDRGASWRSLGPALPYEPTGLLYSPFDAAFYAWRFDCDFGADNPVQPGSIVRLDFEPLA